MYDNFNRQIDYLRLSLTDRCNLRCFYCMPKSGVRLLSRSGILSYEEITAVINASLKLGINKFRITGGEPLLRKGIVKFIGSLNKVQGIEDLSLTTNGIKLKEYARELYKAGLKRINVSLDTLKEHKFRQITRTGNLTEVLEGIEAAINLGFSPIKINMVAIRGVNDDEILDFARLAFDKPVIVRFIELMPIGESRFLEKEKIVPVEEIKSRCRLLGKLESGDGIKGSGPAEYYQIKDGRGKVGFISAITNPFCGKCNRLRLTADGFLKLCLGYDNKVDLKPALRPKVNVFQLAHLIKQAINLKPEAHNMNKGEYANCSGQMSNIGG